MSQEGLTEAAQLVKGEAKPQAHISLEEAGIPRQWRSCGGRGESCPMGKGGQGLACSAPVPRAPVCFPGHFAGRSGRGLWLLEPWLRDILGAFRASGEWPGWGLERGFLLQAGLHPPHPRGPSLHRRLEEKGNERKVAAHLLPACLERSSHLPISSSAPEGRELAVVTGECLREGRGRWPISFCCFLPLLARSLSLSLSEFLVS